MIRPNGLTAAVNTMDRCVAPDLQFRPSPVRFRSRVRCSGFAASSARWCTPWTSPGLSDGRACRSSWRKRATTIQRSPRLDSIVTNFYFTEPAWQLLQRNLAKRRLMPCSKFGEIQQDTCAVRWYFAGTMGRHPSIRAHALMPLAQPSHRSRCGAC
jgi:hypothetical protein